MTGGNIKTQEVSVPSTASSGSVRHRKVRRVAPPEVERFTDLMRRSSSLTKEHRASWGPMKDDCIVKLRTTTSSEAEELRENIADLNALMNFARIIHGSCPSQVPHCCASAHQCKFSSQASLRSKQRR